MSPPPYLPPACRLFLRSLDLDGKGFFSRESAIQGLRGIVPLLEEASTTFGNPLPSPSGLQYQVYPPVWRHDETHAPLTLVGNRRFEMLNYGEIRVSRTPLTTYHGRLQFGNEKMRR